MKTVTVLAVSLLTMLLVSCAGPQMVPTPTFMPRTASTVIAEIVALRSPSEALIRTIEPYSQWSVSEAKRQGSHELEHQHWTGAH